MYYLSQYGLYRNLQLSSNLLKDITVWFRRLFIYLFFTFVQSSYFSGKITSALVLPETDRVSFSTSNSAGSTFAFKIL